MNDLEEWVAKGLEASDVQNDKGASYFSLQTDRAEMLLKDW